MNPNTVKTLMTVAAAIAGALAFVPQLSAYQTALASLASALTAWAHGKRPGDMTEEQVAASAKGAGQ